MKHFNLEDFIANLQEHLQNIDVANPNSNVNNDSKQLKLTSVFEFLLNKYALLQFNSIQFNLGLFLSQNHMKAKH